MLLVPYSSMIWTMLPRSPVRMEAIAMTVMMPITMPRIVRKLLNFWALRLSRAIAMVSLFMSRSFMTPNSILGKRYYRIEPRGFYRRVYSKEHADSAREEHRTYHIEYCDCHGYGGRGPDQPRNGGGHHQPKHSSKRRQNR